MATSGTVGLTAFNLADTIDLAMRRCRINPSLQTVEVVDSVRKALFTVLTSNAARGLNLWRMVHGFLGMIPGVIRYDLPVGTICVTNLNFVINSVSDRLLTSIVGGYQLDPVSAVTSCRIGIKVNTDFIAPLNFATSTDGVIFTSQLVVPPTAYVKGSWYWFELPVTEAIVSFQVTSVTPFVLDDAAVGSQPNTIIPLWQWNLDDYSQQPTRNLLGRPSTNFYFDKQRVPKVWVWPCPSNEFDYLEYWIHQQIEDINLLTEEVDVPQRWVNAVIWLLAKEICFLMPVDAELVPLVMIEADKALGEAELGETDGATTTMAPNISVYTR